VVGV
jgi:hypothetical protein